ncbi:hypothetical protein EFK50_04425 [Nocardioides marmoriginsengisoli]|uniref:Uncharacterized protein n=1 Tax=Nocardioides marmoriginsengisoli TaxID=661483 RepID=A0A3N0CP41_9ACTN|nr:hypothetical protein EFK50_04425 [Nocardioides marmoriginsengisoli]
MRGERASWFAVRRTASLLRCRDAPYMAPATVAITLARAAPMIVPATPRYEAANAAEEAARALAAMWLRLSGDFGEDMAAFLGQLSRAAFVRAVRTRFGSP